MDEIFKLLKYICNQILNDDVYTHVRIVYIIFEAVNHYVNAISTRAKKIFIRLKCKQAI